MSLEGIAIIGMAGRFPEAPTLQEFYQNLKQGRDSVRLLGRERMDSTGLSAGVRYKAIAYLEDIDKFDHQFFGILESEAVNMAPQQRIMLELAYETIESSGYSLGSLKGTSASVYIASNAIEYHRHAAAFDTTLLTGNLPSCIPGRISRFFHWTGPAVHVDTACSSSLVALHLACESLLSGNSAIALCGGVNLVLFPAANDVDEQTGITSAHGKSKTFSADAQGAGMGEAAACVLLKPLRKAINDGDNILAVIRGTAANQDAHRSSTLTAPSSIAQAEVITSANKRAAVAPDTISFIEAHGTGTYQGDPIEIEGLRLAFEPFTSKKQFCAISALKSNIGHTDAAAGIAGVVKTVLSLQHKELFPSLHVTKLNPHIDFLRSPLYVNVAHRPWHSTGPRRAGVSAFGISGTNCHAVLEEWADEAADPVAPAPYLFFISGLDDHALKRNAAALRKFVDENRDVSVDRISYTMNTGRELFKRRIAVVAESHEELIQVLDRAIAQLTEADPPTTTWLLFSPSIRTTDQELRALRDMFPVFDDSFGKCEQALRNLPEHVRFSFAFGYSISQTLKALGIQVTHLMGIGAGKEVVRTIQEDRSLEQVSESLQQRTHEPLATPSWDAFVKTKVGTENTQVWEIGVGAMHHKGLHPYTNAGVPVSASNPLENGAVNGLLNLIAQGLIKGASPTLETLYTVKPRRVTLPSYQFERKRCWLPSADKHATDSWIYQLRWEKQAAASHGSRIAKEEPIVIYCRDTTAGARIANKFRTQGHPVLMVSCGDSSQVDANADLAFDWKNTGSSREFGQALRARHFHEAWQLFVCEHTRPGVPVENALGSTLYAALSFVQVLASNSERFRVCVITHDAVLTDIKSSEVDAYGAALHGFAAGVRREYASASIRCVDVSTDEQEPYELLYDEVVSGDSNEAVVALRDGARFVRRLAKPQPRREITLSAGSVYVLAGGSSGIGLQIVSYLSLFKAHIVVIGRRKIPAKRFWPFMTAASHPEQYDTVQTFLRAEDQGAIISYFSADISDTLRVREILKTVRDKYGAIRGVINAAGVGGQMRISRHTVATFRETLLPKIHGSVNLVEFTERESLDFFIGFSSLNAMVAAERESNYSAANAFMDSFAAELNQRGIQAMSIRWPLWNQTGMGMRLGLSNEFNVPAELTLTNQEGIDVFRQALQYGYADLMVLKADVTGQSIDALFNTHNTSSKLHVRSGADAGSTETVPADYEVMLAALWKIVLGKNDIGINDNFFQLGGHSLLAIQVRNQIEKRTRVKLEYKDMMECSTIAALATRLRALKAQQQGDETSPDETIISLPKEERYSVSEAQKGLWFASVAERDNTVYNVRFSYETTYRVEREVLYTSVQHMLERHEILRSAIVLQDEQLVQTVAPPDRVEPPVEIVVADTAALRKKAFYDVRHHSFNLGVAPLFKIWLLRSASRKDAILVCMHHIIVDGWSAHIFLDELLKTYVTLADQVQPALPPLTIQYRDYASWEKKLLRKKEFVYESFWRGYLSGLPPCLNLPTDYPRQRVRNGEGSCVHFQLTRLHYDGFRMIAQQKNVSTFLITFTLWQTLLYRYTGQNDFFIGVPVSLRDRDELEHLIGYFVNMLPFRCRASGSDTFYDLLARNAATMKEIQEHRYFPFGRIVETGKIMREPGRHFLFDVIFSYEHTPGSVSAVDEAAADIVEFNSVNSKYDIEFVLKEATDGITAIITYDPDLFDRSTIGKMADHFNALADAITLNVTLDQFALENTSTRVNTKATRDLDLHF